MVGSLKKELKKKIKKIRRNPWSRILGILDVDSLIEKLSSCLKLSPTLTMVRRCPLLATSLLYHFFPLAHGNILDLCAVVFCFVLSVSDKPTSGLNWTRKPCDSCLMQQFKATGVKEREGIREIPPGVQSQCFF